MPLPELGQVEQRISGLFQDSAMETVTSLSNRQLCLVTQSRGNDPERFLVPQIIFQLLANGYGGIQAVRGIGRYLDTNIWHASPETPDLDSGNIKVLIIAEADFPSRRMPELIETVLEDCRKANCAVIPIVNYRLNRTDQATELAKMWQEGAGKVFGQEPAGVQLPQILLTRTLAKDYLTALCQSYMPASERVIDYILQIVPPRIAVLQHLIVDVGDDHYLFENEKGAQQTINSKVESWWEMGYITEKDYRTVQRRCLVDRQIFWPLGPKQT
ncbi:hypothetical protein HYW43_01940 [Candidatus Daviesbacteria bacterium]|nr:hypothetical protein [Candidatus Daviesbacteria bacterium]